MLHELQQKLTAAKDRLLTTLLPEGSDPEDVIYIQLDLQDNEVNLHWSKDLGVLGVKEAVDNNYTSEPGMSILRTMVMNWIGLDIAAIPLESWVEILPEYK